MWGYNVIGTDISFGSNNNGPTLSVLSGGILQMYPCLIGGVKNKITY